MDIILVPGLWLDASSWDEVTPALNAAGHRVRALTMPGVGIPAPESSEVGIADWVASTVEAIDASADAVVLIGHSGGGNVVWGAADARPDRVERVIFVDTVPPPPARGISEFDIVDGVIPFPGWAFFPDEDVFDLNEDVRARAAARAKSVPKLVPTDPIELTGGGRHGVPVTLLMGSMDQEAVEKEVAQWGAYGEEYLAIDDVTVARIGSGHWPQFSVPERLSELILQALGSVPHPEAAVDRDDRT